NYSGGYFTLSFIPTLGTMILGLIAGAWLRESRPQIPMKKLLIAGVSGIVLRLALHYSHICPVVKRIWTPSWTIFSGGICFLFLAAFSCVIDVKGLIKWGVPACCHRHELDRCILHRALHGRFSG